MISEAVVKALGNYVPESNIMLNVPMAEHTTFRVGGPCDCLVEPEDIDQLSLVVRYLNKVEIPFVAVGNGSNLLVSDEGYRGVVLHIYGSMSRIRVEGDRIIAQAGALMSRIARVAWENGLTGLEFASGIPGTIGGGVVMNAGAYGGELKDVVTLVKVVNDEGETMELDNAAMEFGYRESRIKHGHFYVGEVTIQLKKGDPEQIKALMEDYAGRRRDKQPLEYPSAGSTFKRPTGYYAGQLIQDAGLKGFTVGGAQVSEKHAGFVINKGGATAKDIYTLITIVQDKVHEDYNVKLEPEVVLLGVF